MAATLSCAISKITHSIIFYNTRFVEPNGYSLGMDAFSAVADPRRRAILD